MGAKQSTASGWSPSSLSLTEMIKPDCLKREQRKRRRETSRRRPPPKRMPKTRKVRTLEDWLLTSPARDQQAKTWLPEYDDADESYLIKQFSRKVHLPAAKVQVPEGAAAAGASFVPVMSGNASGRQKKRVSFKLPEEADIITFYSPEDHETAGNEQPVFPILS